MTDAQPDPTELQRLRSLAQKVSLILFVALLAAMALAASRLSDLNEALREGTAALQEIEERKEELEAEYAEKEKVLEAEHEARRAELQTEISDLNATLDERRAEVERLEGAIRTIDPISTTENSPPPPPRVYIQIASESQRPAGKQLAQLLNSRGFLAPGVELVGPKAPRETQLRYFRAEDEASAESIAALLSDDLSLSSHYLPNLVGATRPGHFELWLAPGAEPR